MPKIPSLDHQVIELKRWMKRKGWNNDTSLKLRDFPKTGRGVCSLQLFNEGSTIIEIPINLMITFDVMAKSDLPKFLSEPLKIHELLALFLIYERHKGVESEWYNFITSLPGDLPAVPWLRDLVGLPEDFGEEVEKRKAAFEESFVRARKSMGMVVGCLHCKETVDRVFDANSFTWGYVMVNTRAVHVDPDTISPGPILLDDPNMALCPYLDMFNHSDHANTLAELDRSSNTYKLITLTPYKKHEQIFISYGSHNNTKLLCEYGFFIPGNRLDVFNFSFETLIKSMRLNARQYKYVKEKNFDRDLNVSLDGLSFNLKALLYVVFNEDVKDWNPVIYTSNYSKTDLKKMVFTILPWIKDANNCIQDVNCLVVIDYLRYLETFRDTLIEFLAGGV